MSRAAGAMVRAPGRLRTPMAAVLVLAASCSALAQGLAVDVSAGRVVYEPVAARVPSSNLMGAVRYESGERLWIYGSTGVPLRSGDAWWGSTGLGGRIEHPLGRAGRMTVGLDAGGHGYLFRDGILAAQGAGAALDAIPFVGVPAGTARIELRAGWRGQTLAYGGVRDSRGVVESGVRAVYGTTLRTEVDARWVRADEGSYPFAGAGLLYVGRPLQIWLRAGRWLDDELDEVSWGAGLGIAVAARSTLWGRVWHDAPDPLYWNVPRRSWGIGITHGFGTRAIDRGPLQAAVRSGDAVVLSLPVSEARGRSLSIAGDFNGWTPVPMAREGTVWVIRLPLAPGVYHYAFRADDGRWFVPRSVPTRRDDGMGGHVAVLVVG